MSFRVCAKVFFLTFPKIKDCTHQEIHDHLVQHSDHVYSCLEAHQDGTPHVHAILSYTKRRDIKNPRFFDFKGNHCNIQRCKDIDASTTYLEKDGKTLGEPPKSLRNNRQARLQTLINESQTSGDFINGFTEIDAHASIIHHQQIEAYANKRFRRPDSFTPRSRSSFTEPPDLTDWVSSHLFPQPERPKCLIILSPTRFGKTEWARSLGSHTYWNNYVTSERNIEARYAVVDDMERFTNFTGAKGMFGCQKVIGLNPKYSKLQQWEWGIPTIWLFNQLPLEICPGSYYLQNAVLVQLEKPLF